MNQSTEKTPRYTGNVLLPLSILLMCGVFYTQTLDFPELEDVGPEVVPYLWMIILVVFLCLPCFSRSKEKWEPRSRTRTVAYFVYLCVIHYILFTGD